MLHYDPDVKGYFNFDDFCDFIEAPDYLSTKTKRSKKQLGEEKKLQHYIQILKKREQKEGEKERLTKILKSFTRTFLRRKTVLCLCYNWDIYQQLANLLQHYTVSHY